jgi:hypothetical protein
MNKASGLPAYVYLRRGKYLYVEKLGYRPVRLYETPGTEAFDREYAAAVAHLPVRKPGRKPRPPVNVYRPQPLTQDQLRHVLDYDPETGMLTKKAMEPADFAPSKRFTPESFCRMWNGRCAGKPAFTTLTRKGYLAGTVYGQHHLAHRVIWALVHGVWPDTVDHINGNQTDNRLVNLRAANATDQTRNRCRPLSNKSGVVGVSRHKGKWKASIGDGGAPRYLGVYATFEEAVAVRRQAEKDLGYHPNHGRTPTRAEAGAGEGGAGDQ